MDKALEKNTLSASAIKEVADRFISNVGKVIVGKREVIEFVLVALLCEGHILIEDVPGTGKTMLARQPPGHWAVALREFSLLPTCCPRM